MVSKMVKFWLRLVLILRFRAHLEEAVGQKDELGPINIYIYYTAIQL